MQYITLLLGIIIGILTGRRVAEHFMLLNYHYRFMKSESKFLDVYDLVDDEFHYEMYSGTTDNPPKKYADFLRLHQKLRPKAFEIYSDYINQLKKHVLRQLIIVAVIPAFLLFWTTWYYYVITFALVVLGFAIFVRYKKDNGLDFHAILIVSLVFNHKSK